jgi:hypothetical protein
LRSPSQAGEIGILAPFRRSVEFGGLSLRTAFFFVTLPLMTCLFTFSLGKRGFAWSSHDFSFWGAMGLCQVSCRAVPRLWAVSDNLDADLACPFFSFC